MEDRRAVSIITALIRKEYTAGSIQSDLLIKWLDDTVKHEAEYRSELVSIKKDLSKMLKEDAKKIENIAKALESVTLH